MKVLIADDDPVSRRLLQTYLERWGHEVTAAADGEQAWALFEEGAFAIVVTDWMMPGIDGVELIRRIRAAAPKEDRPPYVYAILLTARSEKEDLVRGMEAGADDFVSKPFDRDELRVRLREGERIIQLEYDLQSQNRALQEAQAALAETERLAAAGRAAGEVAQELEGPLSELSASLNRLRQALPDSEHPMGREVERACAAFGRLQEAARKLPK